MNTPVTNQALLDAIKLMKEDKRYEPQMIDELFRASLLCPGVVDKKDATMTSDGGFIVGEGTTMALLSMADVSGKHYLLAFTDWDELRKWSLDEKQQAILLPFEELRSIIVNNPQYEGLAINPFGVNIAFNSDSLTTLCPTKHVLHKDNPVMIGIPEDYPTAMVDKLKEHFQNTRTVETAYLLLMAKGDSLSYLLVLGSSQSPQEVFPAIGEVCKPYLSNTPLDMIPLNTPFGQNAIENQAPFFRL